MTIKITATLAIFFYIGISLRQPRNTTKELTLYTKPPEIKLQNKAVEPSHFQLPTQINYHPKHACNQMVDYPDNFKCPQHHKYTYSKVKTKQKVPKTGSKYGGYACKVDVICSNVYDADRIGEVYMGFK